MVTPNDILVAWVAERNSYTTTLVDNDEYAPDVYYTLHRCGEYVTTGTLAVIHSVVDTACSSAVMELIITTMT